MSSLSINIDDFLKSLQNISLFGWLSSDSSSLQSSSQSSRSSSDVKPFVFGIIGGCIAAASLSYIQKYTKRIKRGVSAESEPGTIIASTLVKNEHFEEYLEKYIWRYAPLPDCLDDTEDDDVEEKPHKREHCTPLDRTMVASHKQTTHVIRLKPNELIMHTLKQYLKPNKSYWIVSAAGSVKSVILRMANDKEGMWVFDEEKLFDDILRTFEICSFSGSISEGHRPHLHGAFSDDRGRCIGGHFVEGVVYTTLELCLIENDEVTMRRQQDEDTGFDELVVQRGE
uniref:PPC domain-containing protein n=1 Tax=Percolomonas cosmopolitus TaxID=63605 RepID=A0A7S1KNU0_9EUKA|mmetsp:Transcript_3319/g.12623  ORF Transcript_3319/g.12623 Transcript_3319/m.12623 type:complete len:284 (+) Transcript_3319:1-852(+)